MDVDVEMCGSDQKFNALTGRTLLKKIKDKEKFVFITTLLENPKTGEKMMSKSLGTGVFLDFDAQTMFGALMAQPDENMKQLFTDCTWFSLEEIETIISDSHPMEAKKKLAFEITQIYHLAALLSATGEKDPRWAWKLNMESLLFVLEAAQELKLAKVYWPSSIAAFGPTTPKQNTPQDTIMDPTTVYGITKLAGELWCEYYFRRYGVDVRSLRYPGLIG
jgi:hypothetical protein